MASKAALILALAVGTSAQHTYTSVGGGGCRGNGGTTDNVNGKEQLGLTEAECKAACDALSDCLGITYETGAAATASAQCVVHSPTAAGSCSDATLNTQTKCSDKGTCSDAAATTPTACANVGGTWTSAGAVWTGPDAPWTASSYSTIYIAAGSGGTDFTCFDVDLNDHLATCAEPASGGSGTCASDFAAATGSDEADCCADCSATGACVYTAAPTMESVVTPHEPDALHCDTVYKEGVSGACRGTDPTTGTFASTNGKYANSCDINGKKKTTCGGTGQVSCSPMTQAECEAGCRAENLASPGACKAYHHGAWCSVYGDNVHAGIGITDADPCWFANPGALAAGAEVDNVKPNIGYICWVVKAGVTGASRSSFPRPRTQTQHDRLTTQISRVCLRAATAPRRRRSPSAPRSPRGSSPSCPTTDASRPSPNRRPPDPLPPPEYNVTGSERNVSTSGLTQHEVRLAGERALEALGRGPRGHALAHRVRPAGRDGAPLPGLRRLRQARVDVARAARGVQDVVAGHLRRLGGALGPGVLPAAGLLGLVEVLAVGVQDRLLLQAGRREELVGARHDLVLRLLRLLGGRSFWQNECRGRERRAAADGRGRGGRRLQGAGCSDGEQ